MSLWRKLAAGSASLSGATVIERGLGFAASAVAARLAGPEVFGAYAVVLATAGTVANYAGAGIGTTATRFSADHPRDTAGYHGLLRSVSTLALASALLGGAGLAAAAGPLASGVLQRPELTMPLRVAGLVAAATVLGAALRGLLVGQQRHGAQLLLAALGGLGLLLGLPWAASRGATALVAAQGATALFAVLVVVLLAGPLGLVGGAGGRGAGPARGALLRFGLVQLSAVAGLGLAAWWIAAMLARGADGLVQAGLFAAASQLRNLASTLPGIPAQVAFPWLTGVRAQELGGADRVTLASAVVSLVVVLAGVAALLVALPWLLAALYGEAFRAAQPAAALLLATALVHMASVPPTNRLNVVSLPAMSWVSATWTALMMLGGALLAERFGAAGAAACWFAAHLAALLLVLVALYRTRALPPGLLRLLLPSTLAAPALAALAHQGTVGCFAAAALALLLLWDALATGRRLLGARR